MKARPKETPPRKLDVIGDVHGDADRLKALLEKLEYAPINGVWTHPSGRTAVFLGDLVDRGPKVAETLAVVRAMVRGGTARMILGNHEFNLLCLLTPDGKGGFIRPHTERNLKTCRTTLEDFRGRENELAEHLEWFRTLPLYLDLGDCRFIHAEWNAELVSAVNGRRHLDDEFLRMAAVKGTTEHSIIEILLKGNEIPLPPGVSFLDHDGTPRHHVRVCWAKGAAGKSYREVALPAGDRIPDVPVPSTVSDGITGYPGEAPPVLYGHYGLAAWPHGIVTPNTACLDHGCGKGGRLVAYRWDGERRLTPDKIIEA